MKNLVLVLLLTIITLTSCDIPKQSNIQSTNQAVEALSTESALSDRAVSSFTDIDENSYGREQSITEVSQSNFNKNQPPKLLEWSLERDNLNKRNARWNNPNKVSYIYILSDTGIIISYFTIKGKVSSVNSKLTTNQQVVRRYYGSATSGVVESPSMDGSYGSNGDAVFFFLTDGTYMEWAGKYLLSDNYIRLVQKPVLTYDMEKAGKLN
tara:strand:- start:265 stop:894 length:630 start_codon:yes stop_codon:yes gene_type:complete